MKKLLRVAQTAAAVAAVFCTAQAQQTPTAPPAGPRVQSTAKIAPSETVRYDNKYEVYGGLSFMNGEAGQSLRKRYNMGGGEVMGTWWVKPRLGVVADYRYEAGTTPVLSPYYNRVLITQSIVSGGVQYRGFGNRYIAVDYHGLFGAAHGTFDNAIKNYPGGSPVSAAQLGLYPNKTTPWGAVGGSIDFNYTSRFAVRLSPDMIFEHYGTELREYVSVSGGVMYRFGRRK